MNLKELRKISEKNEIRIDNHRGYKRSPAHYYDSLRQALGVYFNTFNTQNAQYHSYAEGLHKRDTSIFKRQLLDKENTVLAIVAFERFFELFIKDLLKKVNPKLAYISSKRLSNTLDLVNQIESRIFVSKKFDNRNLTIPFRETLERFYGIFDLHKQSLTSSVVRKFYRHSKAYEFLNSADCKSTLQLLNWYRDRILHNGNSLPSLWLLDYLVTQRLIPIVLGIIKIENSTLGDSLFYIKTITGIDILDRMASIKFDFKDLRRKNKKSKVFDSLLHIGHLKELGRANLNMNLFVRNNWQATYEYNYKVLRGEVRDLRLKKKKNTQMQKKLRNAFVVLWNHW